MIIESERKKLKEMIGGMWISRLNKHFIEINMINRYGDHYSAQYISLVFNGKTKNEKLERAIYDFAVIRKKEVDDEAARRKSILEE